MNDHCEDVEGVDDVEGVEIFNEEAMLGCEGRVTSCFEVRIDEGVSGAPDEEVVDGEGRKDGPNRGQLEDALMMKRTRLRKDQKRERFGSKRLMRMKKKEPKKPPFKI